MKTQDVIDYFGSGAAVARAVGISQPAVSKWGEDVPGSRITNVRLAMMIEQQRRDNLAKRPRIRGAVKPEATDVRNPETQDDQRGQAAAF